MARGSRFSRLTRRGCGLRISRIDGAEERALAPGFVDVLTAAWLPDSTHVVIQARIDLEIRGRRTGLSRLTAGPW